MKHITIKRAAGWLGFGYLNQGRWIGLRVGPILIVRTPWKVR